MFQVFGLDADPGILDGHRHLLILPAGADRDHPAVGLLTGIGRIGQEVEEDLFDLIRDGPNRRQPLRVIADHRNPPAIKIALLQQQDGVEGVVHIHHRFSARGGSIKILKTVDQILDPHTLTNSRFQQFLVFLFQYRPFFQAVEDGEDSLQGIVEFLGDGSG